MASSLTPHGSQPTQGLLAAAVTAFQSDGSIDLGFIPSMAGKMREDGIAGVFVNGTTGEGLSLDIKERETQAEAWKNALPSGMKLFVHAGALALPDARRLAAHAECIGADAIAALAPGFFKPSGIPGVIDWCAAIADAAPRTPFYFYHMPSMNGVHLRVADFLDQVEGRIPTLAGVKFTFEAMDDYLLSQHLADGKYEMLWGRDEMLLGALATGAKAAVGSTYNIAAPLYHGIISAFESGDLNKARHLQADACRMIHRLVDTGAFFSALKAELASQGLPITPQVRRPLVPLKA